MGLLDSGVTSCDPFLFWHESMGENDAIALASGRGCDADKCGECNEQGGTRGYDDYDGRARLAGLGWSALNWAVRLRISGRRPAPLHMATDLNTRAAWKKSADAHEHLRVLAGSTQRSEGNGSGALCHPRVLRTLVDLRVRCPTGQVKKVRR